MLSNLGTDAKLHGNLIKMVVLKSKATGVYENVQALYDGNKLLGLFQREGQAYIWWLKVYVPSRRSASSIGDSWEIPEWLLKLS